MFQGEADRRQSLWTIMRRLCRLLLGWLGFCGWRLTTLVGEMLSLRRWKASLRRRRADGARHGTAGNGRRRERHG
jgi:hypothetical protein